MKIFTIGFTKKTAEEFFETLCISGVKRLIDVRLNNVSQLAGFAKKQDLAYLARKLCGIEYVHLPVLAPTQEMLDEYRKGNCGWDRYEENFLRLMRERKIEDSVSRELLGNGCLLCSEDDPAHCHRRLVAEYLKQEWGDVEIEHLPRGVGDRQEKKSVSPPAPAP